MDTCIKYNILRLIDDHKHEMKENEYVKMCNYMKYIHEIETDSYKSTPNRTYVQYTIITGPRSDSSQEREQTPTIYDFLRK